MKKYELLSIIKPNLDMEEVEKVIVNLEKTIVDFGGSVQNIDKAGRKKLAYDINKYRDGFYAILNIEFPADKLVELKRNLKLNESILRNMIFEAQKVKAQVK